MTCTIKAILARFNGNKADAIAYCDRIASNHPILSTEYRALIDLLRISHA